MKAAISIAVLASAACLAAIAVAASTSDDQVKEMAKCAVCKFMAEDPKLMESVAWECHKIDEGMLCMASVPKEMKNAFDAVHKKMMAAVATIKAHPDQPVELCGMCESMGQLEKAGAKQQTIDTAVGCVHLVTAADPAVVKQIHAQADKAMAEHEHAEPSSN